jgi:hypothetical protein
MTVANLLLFLVDLVFDVAERVDRWNTRRKRKGKPAPVGLSWKDVLEIKRQSDAGARRSEAPTVVIPPPSELLGGRSPPPRKPSPKR